MITLSDEPRAKEVHFDRDNLWVDLTDGRRLSVPLAFFPRLARAKPEQRLNYVISGGGIGIHWEALDEDISLPALLMGIGDRTVKRQGRTRKKEGTLSAASMLRI